MNLTMNTLSSTMATQLKLSALSSSSSSYSRPQPPKIPKKPLINTTSKFTSKIPARDRVIDLGKHKGKMLGTLPSNYLRWVSKNLRAGETEEWARLADLVLNDPVYRDRIEWEYAEKILQGDSANYDGTDSVSQLLEISERFGWDNDDKVGWSKINFTLLGTSKGGRIPRIDRDVKTDDNGDDDSELLKDRTKNGGNSKVEDVVSGGERRRERRERLRRQRSTTSGEKSYDDDDDSSRKVVEDNNVYGTAVGNRRFPGRESLINKALNRRRVL